MNVTICKLSETERHRWKEVSNHNGQQITEVCKECGLLKVEIAFRDGYGCKTFYYEAIQSE